MSPAKTRSLHGRPQAARPAAARRQAMERSARRSWPGLPAHGELPGQQLPEVGAQQHEERARSRRTPGPRTPRFSTKGAKTSAARKPSTTLGRLAIISITGLIRACTSRVQELAGVDGRQQRQRQAEQQRVERGLERAEDQRHEAELGLEVVRRPPRTARRRPARRSPRTRPAAAASARLISGWGASTSPERRRPRRPAARITSSRGAMVTAATGAAGLPARPSRRSAGHVVEADRAVGDSRRPACASACETPRAVTAARPGLQRVDRRRSGRQSPADRATGNQTREAAALVARRPGTPCRPRKVRAVSRAPAVRRQVRARRPGVKSPCRRLPQQQPCWPSARPAAPDVARSRRAADPSPGAPRDRARAAASVDVAAPAAQAVASPVSMLVFQVRRRSWKTPAESRAAVMDPSVVRDHVEQHDRRRRPRRSRSSSSRVRRWRRNWFSGRPLDDGRRQRHGSPRRPGPAGRPATSSCSRYSVAKSSTRRHAPSRRRSRRRAVAAAAGEGQAAVGASHRVQPQGRQAPPAGAGCDAVIVPSAQQGPGHGARSRRCPGAGRPRRRGPLSPPAAEATAAGSIRRGQRAAAGPPRAGTARPARPPRCRRCR